MGLISVISPTRFQSEIIKRYIRAAFATKILDAEIVDESDKKDYFILSKGVRIQIMVGDFRTVRGFTQLNSIRERTGENYPSRKFSDFYIFCFQKIPVITVMVLLLFAMATNGK